MYFEHNLSKTAPAHFQSENAKRQWEATVERIDKRFNKLEQALTMSGLRGEDFAEAMKTLFDKTRDESPLDRLSEPELAAYGKSWCCGREPIPDRLEFPNAVVILDEAFLTTRDWEFIRCNSIGGSETAQLLGLSEYGTENSLYHAKVCTELAPKPADPGQEHIFAYGHTVEPLVISTFVKRMGWQHLNETRMFRSKSCPAMHGNFDGIVRNPANGDIFIFEAKTRGSRWKMAVDPWEDGQVPAHYECQCHQYMAVANDPRIKGAYIACIDGNTLDDFRSRFIPIDEDQQALIKTTIQEFWDNYIVSGIEPEMKGTPSIELDTMNRKGGFVNQEIVLPNVYQAMAEEYMELTAEEKRIEEQKKVIALEIRKALGSNTRGTLPSSHDGRMIRASVSESIRRDVDKELLEERYPAIFAEVAKEKTTIRFGIREVKCPKK